MEEYDEAVLTCFLKNQLQLFPKEVAMSQHSAKSFLEESMAIVVNSVKEVWDFFDEEGIDMEGANEDEILEAEEVFIIGDGRFLIVQG